MASITAYFFGEPCGHLERACSHIFEARRGVYIGSGTCLIGGAAGERDVQYEVPDDLADECREALKVAGFRLEGTPWTDDGEWGVPDLDLDNLPTTIQ